MVGTSETVLEVAGKYGIPLTASPDGATNRGTIDAKDERRRSDVQNMVADGLQVENQVSVQEVHLFCEKERVSG